MKYGVQKICWIAPDFNAQTTRRVEGIGRALSLPITIYKCHDDIDSDDYNHCALIVNPGIQALESSEPRWGKTIRICGELPADDEQNTNFILIPRDADPGTIFPRIAALIVLSFKAERRPPSWHALSLNADGTIGQLKETAAKWCRANKIESYATVAKFLKFATVLGEKIGDVKASALISHDGNQFQASIKIPATDAPESLVRLFLRPGLFISCATLKSGPDFVEMTWQANLWRKDEQAIISVIHDMPADSATKRRAS